VTADNVTHGNTMLTENICEKQILGIISVKVTHSVMFLAWELKKVSQYLLTLNMQSASEDQINKDSGIV
jgi:hypothetical protein